MSETKLFEGLHVWTFFRKRGGLPNSKLFEELFCLSLDIYQEGGGVPDSKTFEELFCLRLDIF